MLRLLVSMSMVVLWSGSVGADGVDRTSSKTAAASLPAAQPSVAVTVERGVRVWRPLGTDGGVETGYPQVVNLGPAGGLIAVPVYGGGAVGLFTGFGGGYGKAYGRKSWHGHTGGRWYGFKHSRRGGGWGHAGHGPKRMAFVGRGWHGGKPRGHGHR